MQREFIICIVSPSSKPFSAVVPVNQLFNTLRCGSCCCCLVAQLCSILCHPVDCSTPGLPVLHYLPELAQTHLHWIGDDIQPSHPLSSPFPAFNLSQRHGLFQWVGSSHQEAKGLELQLQHQSFQWIFNWATNTTRHQAQISGLGASPFLGHDTCFLFLSKV